MRKPTLMLCCVFVLSSLGFGQQATARPKKILTPEQQAYQQRMKEVEAQRENLRSEAKHAFDAEMAKEKAGDCPDADNTREFNICFGKVEEFTDQNLKAYEGAIRELLSLKYPKLSAQASEATAAGAELTPEQSAAEFDRLEQAWHSYLEIASSAALHQFGEGSGGPSVEVQCHLRLVRSHMRELDGVYGVLLHL